MSTSTTPWQTLANFNLPSQPGSDRLAREQVAAAVHSLNLSADDLERLKTAVAEATLNAIEHGNHYRPDLPVTIRVQASEKAIAVHVTDRGEGDILTPAAPNLGAKVSGREPPRGWGFFLIQRMVDDVQISVDESHHTIELFLYLEGDK